MDTTAYPQQLLELMDRPAFCVCGGTIQSANQAALQRLIPVGEPVLPLLLTGQEEYAEFSGGCLFLTIQVQDVSFGASVTRVDGMDVFTMEPEYASSELQALALAARELRDPLNRILSITDDLFPKLAGDDAAADQVARVNRGLYQLLRLVGNMSDAGAAAIPRMEMRDVTAVAQELFDTTKDLCASTGVALDFQNLPVSVYSLIDSDRLERGFYNILSNALKYTPAGGTIQIRLTRRKNTLYFTVTDSGCGIDRSASTDIFSRFLRVPGIEDGRHGIGLGMSLVRSAAAIHGGTVLLDKAGEGGTRITMSLPIRQTGTQVRSPIMHIDYAGERSHSLIELADTLPHGLYAPQQKD